MKFSGETRGSLHSPANEKRHENQAALKEAVEKALKQDSARAWRSKLESAGIPVGPVQTVEAAEKMAQIRVRHMIFALGGKKVPGNPMKFGAYDSSPAPILPPALDKNGAKLPEEFKAA